MNYDDDPHKAPLKSFVDTIVKHFFFISLKKKGMRFTGTAAAVQMAPHIWFLSVVSFFFHPWKYMTLAFSRLSDNYF